MNFSKIEIRTKGTSTEVFIDGNQVKGVIGLTFSHEVPGVARVHMDMYATDATITGEAEVYVDKNVPSK